MDGLTKVINVMLTAPLAPDVPNTDLEVRQVQWMHQAILMCLAKERVVGIYCTNWNEPSSADSEVPLVDETGAPKATLQLLQRLADEYWR